MGCIVEGVPPRMPLNEDDIQGQLSRRRPGQSNLTTAVRIPALFPSSSLSLFLSPGFQCEVILYCHTNDTNIYIFTLFALSFSILVCVYVCFYVFLVCVCVCVCVHVRSEIELLLLCSFLSSSSLSFFPSFSPLFLSFSFCHTLFVGFPSLLPLFMLILPSCLCS